MGLTAITVLVISIVILIISAFAEYQKKRDQKKLTQQKIDKWFHKYTNPL